MRWLTAYLGAGLAMGVLDAIWLAVVGPQLYRPVIGPLLADKPDMRAAIVFYLIYVLGVVFLAVMPALKEESLGRAAIAGAVLGLVAYATYDLTNQATLRIWGTHISLIDIAWGIVVTTAAAVSGYLAANRFG